MALTWDVTKVKNHKTRCYQQSIDDNGKPEFDDNGKPLYQLKPLTEALIWSTIMVDLGEITEKNYREFAWRLRLYSATTGDKLMLQLGDDGEREGYDPTEDEVKAHIGMRCNVCDITTAQFMAKLRRVWKERQADLKRWAAQEAAEAATEAAE
jgi:hypothetical protein